MNKKQHGGTRYHPPGREGGRPPNLYPTRLLKLQMTDDEWGRLLANLPKNTRQRAEFIIKLLAP